MGRARKKHPKRNTYCLRLTDSQQLLLQRYAEFRDYESEVDAIRGMIDGLEDWFLRQRSRAEAASDTSIPEAASDTSVTSRSAAGGSHSGLAPRDPDSGLSQVTDVEPSDVDGASVGDFAGRPSVGLPESRSGGAD